MLDSPERMSFSVNEAAAMIGLGRTTFYGLIKSGKIPVVKIGKRTLIRSTDLKHLITPDDEKAS
jgi:excisionase family DNA binding protein